MRVGVVGCGNIGLRFHIPTIRGVEGMEIVALADPTPAGLVAAQEATGLGDADSYTDWRELIRRPDVDAVVVATPQHVRPAIAIAAAEAGKHLLCEKPLALTPADAHRMVEAARQYRVTLATVHNYTLFPVHRQLKAIVDSGEIGDLETVILNYLSVEDRPGTAGYRPRWRHDVTESGGGVLMDMLHVVYLASWFMGAEPRAVSATVDRRFDDGSDVEDYVLVRYDYPRGHAMINMAWGLGPGGYELMGTRGRIIMTTEGDATLPFVPADRVRVTTSEGTRDLAAEKSFVGGFEGIVSNFRDAAIRGTEPMASGVAGAAVLEAVVAAYKSAALGQEVRLPLEPSDPVYQEGAAGIARLPVPDHSLVRRRGLFGVSRSQM